MTSLGLSAQSTIFKESVKVEGQKQVDLEFTFADNITFKIWDKKEVMVEVSVNINEGKNNDIFSIKSDRSESTIYFEMDKEMWKKLSRKDDGTWNNCNISSEIDYTVYLPKGLKVKSNTISGDYELSYFGSPLDLRTISGVIDVTITEKENLDFRAKTISGEVYSDIEIKYPEGTDGLRQIVGQQFKGRLNAGGIESAFETISGNIYLRKG